MQTALRVTTHVLPGHHLEIIAPEIGEGRCPISELIESLPHRDLEEFKSNMNRWRAEEGRGPAYP